MDGGRDSQQRRQINSLRVSWHQQILADPDVRKHPTALAFAGHVMHRFHVDKGHAEISHKSAAKALGMQKGSALRARNYLLKRGWLQVLERTRSDSGGWCAIRYSLAGGPDDLALEQHTASSVDAEAALP